jgi:hypothetical protein
MELLWDLAWVLLDFALELVAAISWHKNGRSARDEDQPASHKEKSD